MITFSDVKGNTVRLSFSPGVFPLEPKHVLVICRYQGKWLLTNHKVRGWEFPGGRQEEGETLEETAKREVKEETGAEVASLDFIAQYEVQGEDEHFVKNVYFANISRIDKQESYHETLGPILLNESLKPDALDERFSDLMKDDVLKNCLEEIKNKGLI